MRQARRIVLAALAALTLVTISANGATAADNELAVDCIADPLPPTLTSQAAVEPRFSDVAARTPADVVAYLSGSLPGYRGGPEAVLDFSPSDILETMDTVVLEQVRRARGPEALARVHELIARAALDTLRDVYPEGWILVPVDAGHGGKPGYWWDPGSAGTEADHNRAVVAHLQWLAGSAEYPRIVTRPIYNDALADDFGLPAALRKTTMDSILMRQARASMLAAEATDWNERQSEPRQLVHVHELSVHFNAGAGGAMVLHQGATVRPEWVALSRRYAQRYLERVIVDLNASGLLPRTLRRWGGNGLHDDVMMYRPAYFRDDEIRGITLRYGALQGRGYMSRYVETLLAHTGASGR